jgi:hypothetical protein
MEQYAPPLTSLVGECGQTKVTKAKGTKKLPWHWDKVHQRALNPLKATIKKEVVFSYPDYSKIFTSEMVLCPILWGINYHIFMPVRLDEISNWIVDTRLKFVYVYQKNICTVYTYFF